MQLEQAESPEHVREHRGTPMTDQTVPAADADIRWRDWLARGAERDRGTTRRMTGLMVLIAIGLGIWLSATIVVR